MAILEIIQFPHPVLKEKAQPVAGLNPELRRLIEDMIETMYHAPGVGLAANQVAAPKSIIVVDVSTEEEPRNTLVIVNPRIVAMSEECGKGEEKCLSVPDYRAEVERAVKISVLGKDLKGEVLKLDAEGFLARVLQHEIDHLNGTLFIDRIGKLKRQRYVRQRKKALAEEKAESSE